MKRINKETYSFSIPEHWETHDDKGVMSIYDPDGHGALTISSYLSETEVRDCVGVLEKFTLGKGDVRSKKNADFDLFETHYEDASGESLRSVYVWAICRRKQLLLMSYNCIKKELTDEEFSIVSEIVSSVIMHD